MSKKTSIALIAIVTITIGYPEVRNERGAVITPDTRRDVAPGEHFEVDDPDTAQHLIDGGYATEPPAESAVPAARAARDAGKSPTEAVA